MLRFVKQTYFQQGIPFNVHINSIFLQLYYWQLFSNITSTTHEYDNDLNIMIFV